MSSHASAPIASTPSQAAHRPLQGIRVLSLALNLPGPAALMRLQAMGASCTKAEPPSGDPMARYNPTAYKAMHKGLRLLQLDLKHPADQQALKAELALTDVLITSFRPSALKKLGLDWPQLHATYPALIVVSIVGAAGERAEEPGHDLTYMAENDLVQGLSLPPTLYADMGGALATSEAVLQALLVRQAPGSTQGQGVRMEVALSDAANWLALPRQWGLTLPDGDVGGAHAGYGVYPCLDGRVAVAALEPHFARSLCLAAGLDAVQAQAMHTAHTQAAIAGFLASQTRAELDTLARTQDIPLHTLA